MKPKLNFLGQILLRCGGHFSDMSVYFAQRNILVLSVGGVNRHVNISLLFHKSNNSLSQYEPHTHTVCIKHDKVLDQRATWTRRF